jgi:hypothetical protein
MKLLPWTSLNDGFQAYVKFDGCEPNETTLAEQRAAITACLITREPVSYWGGGEGRNASRLVFTDEDRAFGFASVQASNFREQFRKEPIDRRAIRLASESLVHLAHATAWDVPGADAFDLSVVIEDSEEPCLVVNGIGVYPSIQDNPLSRGGVRWIVTAREYESVEPEFLNLADALREAFTMAFRDRLREWTPTT